jgi:predicted oxidoreductase
MQKSEMRPGGAPEAFRRLVDVVVRSDYEESPNDRRAKDAGLAWPILRGPRMLRRSLTGFNGDMRSISLGTSSLSSSRLAYGCWRIAGSGSPEDRESGRRAVAAAYEEGYTLFDLADIYGGGNCERVFGEALREVSGMRDQVLIATKCGIRFSGDPTPDAPARYDFSAAHILGACDQSLRRLGVERIDLYQLHRPDYLMAPEEVAEAFGRLKEAGKVREFGVSNFRPSQVQALQRACPMKLIVNQVEISLANQTCLEDGTLDQCLAERITPMAWSPLAGGQLGEGGKDLLRWQETYSIAPIQAELDRSAKALGASRAVVALAWLLKHPAGVVPIVGSTDPARIREAAGADDLEISRENWYRLLVAGRAEPLP